MSGTHMQSKPGNVYREENPAPQHRVHDSNEPLPGSLAGQQQFEVRYSDKRICLEMWRALTVHATGPKCFQFRSSLERPAYSGRCVGFLANFFNDVLTVGCATLQEVLLAVAMPTVLWVRQLLWTRL